MWFWTLSPTSIAFCCAIVVFVQAFAHGQTIAEFAEKTRADNGIPELAFAVVSADKILELSVVGKHSVSLDDKASLGDRFHLGSNSKAMTGFVIAKYVELGKLKWDSKFFDLFPEWKKGSAPGYYDITLKDLLSHRAGIQTLEEEEAKIPTFKGAKSQQRKAFGKWVLTLPAAAPEPPATYLYANAGYTLAALMLERATGRTWEQLVDKVFNVDLKLNVGFGFPENRRRKDTWGHRTENDKLVPVPSYKAPKLEYTEPAGDLNMTIGDYARFVWMNVQGLSGVDNYLKASTYEFIHRGIAGYSIGWYNVYEGDQEFSSHTGTVFTYFANTSIDRKKKIGYVVLANSFDEKTTIGVRTLMRKLKEKY